jgi:hypothetical protein
VAGAAALAVLIHPTLQTAARFAAGTAVPAASAPAAALAEGVLRTMVWTRLKLAAAVVLAVTLAGTGAVFTGRPAAGAQDGQGAASAPKPRPATDKKATEDAPASDAKARAESRENLKRIALAMHEYSNQNGGRLPAPAICGKDKKALLSWRVAILPYIEQNNLYKQFHLDEPWDSPHNKKWLEVLPKTYVPVGGAKAPPGYTFYQVFVGKGTAFEKNRQMVLPASFLDGTSSTILVAEAGKPVPWTKPEDLHYADDGPLPELGGLFKDVFQVAFVDGKAYTLKKNCDEKALRAAITRDGGEVFDPDKLLAGPAPQARSLAKELLDAARLRSLTEARRAEVQRQREMLEALQRERDALREKAKPRPAPDLAALERENQRLEKELRKLQDQVAALRDEIRRLKRGPVKPPAPDGRR